MSRNNFSNIFNQRIGVLIVYDVIVTFDAKTTKTQNIYVLHVQSTNKTNK